MDHCPQIEVQILWPPFCRRYRQRHFLEWKRSDFESNYIECCFWSFYTTQAINDTGNDLASSLIQWWLICPKHICVIGPVHWVYLCLNHQIDMQIWIWNGLTVSNIRLMRYIACAGGLWYLIPSRALWCSIAIMFPYFTVNMCWTTHFL